MYTLVFFNLSMGCNQENIRQRPAALHLQVPSPSRGSWVNICKIHIYIYHIVCRLCIYVNYIYICIISYICIYIMVCVNPALFSLHVVCYCGHLYLGNDLPTWGIRSYIGLATVAVPSRPICVLAWCARPSTDIKQRFFSCQLCHSVSKIIGSVLSIFVQIC